jgi:starch synthase
LRSLYQRRFPAQDAVATRHPVQKRVLFASSEFAPYAQTGGLGDAVAGLAHALAESDNDVSVVVPGHRRLLQAGLDWQHHSPMRVRQAGGYVVGDIAVARVNRVTLYAFRTPMFDRHALYDGDDGVRYIAFSRAAAYLAEQLLPDVAVAHDWQAGLLPALLRTTLWRGKTRHIKTVQVVHNNAHQGRFPASCFALTGLAPDLFHPDAVESWGELNLLKAGLTTADRVVCVSPQYAREVQRGFGDGGEGLEGVYRVLDVEGRLSGIANGIDVARYPGLASDADKRIARASLLEETGLSPTVKDGGVIAMIGRMARQKGWDILLDAVDALIARGCVVAMLGDGDSEMAKLAVRKQQAHPGRVWFYEGFNEAVSRRLYAGADAIVVPSRFEPCGLVQLIAQKHRTIPIGHATGGLVDTIVDGETGFLFSPLHSDALVAACDRQLALSSTARRAFADRIGGLDVSFAAQVPRWQALFGQIDARLGTGG